jgi:short-subunit dehydrogenase
VTSLINNAGFGSYGPFHADDPERLGEMIAVNVTNLVDISRAFVNPLRAVLSLAPGLTRTEFFDVVGTDEMGRYASFETPGQVADYGLRVLDRRDPAPSAISGRRNRVLASASRFVTRRTTVRISAAMA